LWLAAAAAAVVWPTAAQHHSGGSSANCWGKVHSLLTKRLVRTLKKYIYAADVVVFNSNYFTHESDFICPFMSQSWIIEGLN
jgi:hypothetical protein